MEITWDDLKAEENFRKHNVPFPEAKSAMQDPLGRVAPDAGHSDEENRFTLIAESTRRRILIITFTINNDDSARLISARRASAAGLAVQLDRIRDRGRGAAFCPCQPGAQGIAHFLLRTNVQAICRFI